MKIVTLNEDQYYNDKLLVEVKDVLLSFSTEEEVFFTFFESSTGNYGYMISKVASEGSNTLTEVQKWKDDGDLVDAVETYHNVHKSIYGIRPRIGNPEDWANINWVRKQTRDCIDREDEYLREQENMNE